MFLLLSGFLLLEFRFLFSPSDSSAWDTATDAEAASEGAVDIGKADLEPPWLASESSSWKREAESSAYKCLLRLHTKLRWSTYKILQYLLKHGPHNRSINRRHGSNPVQRRITGFYTVMPLMSSSTSTCLWTQTTQAWICFAPKSHRVSV